MILKQIVSVKQFKGKHLTHVNDNANFRGKYFMFMHLIKK